MSTAVHFFWKLQTIDGTPLCWWCGLAASFVFSGNPRCPYSTNLRSVTHCSAHYKCIGRYASVHFLNLIPDLLPIQCVCETWLGVSWLYLLAEISEEELCWLISNAWFSMPQGFIRRFIGSMLSRVQECISLNRITTLIPWIFEPPIIENLIIC